MARILLAGAVLLTGVISTWSPLRAQTCSGTQDFSGPYVFTAVRLSYVPQTVAPPATTTPPTPIFVPQPAAAPGTTGQYSLTPVGQLVGWASNPAPFSSVGRVFADGAGMLFATRVDDTAFVRVGSYSVDLNCALTVTLHDGFSSLSSTPLPGVTFQGAVTGRGGEAALAQTSLGSGVLLTFARPFLASGCQAALLGRRYSLSGFGVSADPALPAQGLSPLVFALQFTTDTAGESVSSLASASSTGTFSVNSDCTGSLILISPDRATTRKFALVLAAGDTVAGQLQQPAVLAVLDGPGQLAGFAEIR